MGGFLSFQEPPEESEGYHVLKVTKNSPGYFAGLEPYFDFIIAVQDTRLSKDDDTLQEMLERNLDKPTKLLLYSCRTQDVRETEVIPSNAWGGRGLLGITIRFSKYKGAQEHVWHVLEVAPNSPAAEAGLKPYTDYIIGANTSSYPENSLDILLLSSKKETLTLYVYNSEALECREVFVKPRLKPGGVGILGCEIGRGYLHKVPIPPPPNVHIAKEDELIAVVPTAPVCLSPQPSASSVLNYVQTEPPLTQPVTVSASMSSSSEQSKSAVNQKETSHTTVVQINCPPSQTSSVFSNDSVHISVPVGQSLYPSSQSV